MNTQHVPRQPVVDPRRLKLIKAFDQADERKKELMFRQAMALPCRKVAA